MAGIFKAYDIRGEVGKDLDETIAFRLGRAFATFLGEKREVVVGRDVRKHSPSLSRAFAKGLLSSGCNVIDVGVVSTPVVAFATRYFGYDAGVAVTASHLPAQFNGFKFFDENANAISYESGIREVERLYNQGSFLEGKGSETSRADVLREYEAFLSSKLRFGEREFSVAIDCMHGVMGLIAPKILRNFTSSVYEIRCDASGNFTEHEPDPSKREHLALLASEVKERGCDLGLAFDGDGDRLAVVDENGHVVTPTRVFSLLLENELREREGSKVVVDFVSSLRILELIRELGGEPVICRVGHTYITRKLLESGATIAGELSGHYYYRELFGLDDALFAALKLLEYFSHTNKPLSKLVAKYEEYPMESIRVPIREELKFKFVEDLKRKFQEMGYQIDTLDGVKVVLSDGWLCVRPSNTEAKIAIVYEAKDRATFERLKNLAEEIISSIPR